MKIGILTFHIADNYGAVLQAYGLKETLRDMGHEAYILDYCPRYLTIPYTIVKVGTLGNGIRNFLRNISCIPIRLIRKWRFNKFRCDYLDILPMSKVNDMDVLMAGSDQIWNPDLTGFDFDPTFLLDFPELNENIRKISYAASAGNCMSFGRNLTDSVINSLKKIDAISVRELSLSDKLSVYGIKSTVVLDPVLLGGRKIFDQLVDKSLVPDEPYVLTFSLKYDPTISAFARLQAKKRKIKLMDMCSMYESVLHPKIVQIASVKQFVSLIRYADLIVTSSFHGTAFSILFKRPFVSVGLDSKHSERARLLLASVCLSDAYCNKDCLDDYTIKECLDYGVAEKRLSTGQLNSKQFIFNTITPPNI